MTEQVKQSFIESMQNRTPKQIEEDKRLIEERLRMVREIDEECKKNTIFSLDDILENTK